ncbi:hypothetical protein J7426_12415 [Tropicibacter sp. R16_0]|uniref:hypothetical protein n=1 Tax=Tropicibacter sp. R16_0 TaxID=2821102 RepID=UPI001ADC872D|nr:hypothetical protein [Tropicibacter sp. R16_0]MBO9451070.1 hypothetical protein [Tropicibacter sp. R16_0]
MSAATLLCEIIAQGGKVTSDFYSDDHDFAALVTHGFLRKAGVLASVVCDECDAPHSASVVYEGGGYCCFCPELGFLPLDAARLVAFLPDIPTLISQLADVFACRQRKSSSLYEQTWRIGMVESAAASVMVYFHPTLGTEGDARDLQNALAREARSEWRLVVTTQGTLSMDGRAVVRLDDLVEIDTENGLLRAVADPGILAGIPRKNLGGRPSVHGPMILSIIEERIGNGEALKGRNNEADAVLDLFIRRNPHEKAPSRSSVRDYVTKVRTGR